MGFANSCVNVCSEKSSVVNLIYTDQQLFSHNVINTLVF